MTAYYNEFDPKAAAWLRELIAQGHIAPGDVDTRSIEDVTPDDLAGYTQCHFFAGIGVWSHALRQSGWADDRPVWTGSCPCQPFSAAGKGDGFADERHLWPHFHWLISQCRPPVVFGEQVASKDGLGWLDLVQADLEGSGYASGAVDTCAAGFGAPHIRQRLYWIGVDTLVNAENSRHLRGNVGDETEKECSPLIGKHLIVTDERGRRNDTPYDGASSRLADDSDTGSQGRVFRGSSARWQNQHGYAGRSGTTDGRSSSPTNGFWRSADWLFCRDGKWRPVEPGTFPLAHGAAARVGRLRGYGNAIVSPAAQAFIEAYLETEADQHFRLMSDLTTDNGKQGSIFD